MRSGVKPDVVVLSVGGGGLLCGIVEGLHRNDWVDVPVIAVETEGADSLRQSVRAGDRVELPAITSIATSLGATQVCEQAFIWSKEHASSNIVVSDRAAVCACLRFLADHRVVVEPACGASLAVVYERAPELERFDSVLVVVCGGVGATGRTAAELERALSSPLDRCPSLRGRRASPGAGPGAAVLLGRSACRCAHRGATTP